MTTEESYRDSHKDSIVSTNYDSFFSSRMDSILWDNFIKELLLKELISEKDKGATNFLDFATGTGRVLKVGNKVFDKISAIDISKNMLIEAKKRVPNAKFYCLDVTRECDDSIGEFDCVTLFRFLKNAEHDLRVAVLEWLFEHMPSNGLLIVNNHGNTFSIKNLIAQFAFWLPKNAKNQLSIRETIHLLDDCGFTVYKYEGFGILPTIYGKPIFGRLLQTKLEYILKGLGLSSLGHELVFFARKK